MGPGVVASTSGPDVENYNYIIGTQTFSPQYQFTDKSKLVETAEATQEMGSNILKFIMANNYDKQYGLKKQPHIKTLVDLASQEPSYKTVLEMPFSYYIIWTYCLNWDDGGDANNMWWRDGLSENERESLYQKIYTFTKYLLETYNGTGKTFYLGHWEGDWYLHPDYKGQSPVEDVVIRGMIDWLNTRQKAVDDAKRDTAHQNVQVYHYTEANLVGKDLQSVTNDVVPHVNVDYVSYSCYDSLGWGGKNELKTGKDQRDHLKKALDTIESKLKPKEGIQGKRVFIGEFAFRRNLLKSPYLNDAYCRNVFQAAIEWGCPFVLYWEMYNNEIDEDGNHRGYWLIDNHGVKTQLYYTYKRFYRHAKEYVADFKKKHKSLPTQDQFNHYAAQWFADKSN
jgi:hypothetical protein